MMQRRIQRKSMSSTLAAAILLLGACGGDSNGVSSDDFAYGADAGNASDMGDALENMDEVAEMAGVPEECLAISMAMMGAMGTGANNVGDAETLANIPEAFDAIRSKAPEELRGDIDIVQAGYAEYLDILQRFDYDFAKISADPAALEEMRTAMVSDEFSEASDRFNTWLDSICNSE